MLAMSSAGALGCSSEHGRVARGETDAEPLGEAAQRIGAGPVHAYALDEPSGATATDTGTPGGVNGTVGSSATRFAAGKLGGAVHLSATDANSVINFGTTIGKIGTNDFTA